MDFYRPIPAMVRALQRTSHARTKAFLEHML
jgi:hypothetical protein